MSEVKYGKYRVPGAYNWNTSPPEPIEMACSIIGDQDLISGDKVTLIGIRDQVKGTIIPMWVTSTFVTESKE